MRIAVFLRRLTENTMVRLAISKACLGLLAIVETVSSTPLGKEFFNARSISPSQELVWPTTISSQIHSESWPDFANKTQRWSSYKAPTFDEVFLPKDEHDLALGVSTIFLHVSEKMCAE